MKNIALPILLAKSAKAQRREQMMKADNAFPEPMFIADSYHPDDCVDITGTDVADALSALNSAQGALDALVLEQVDLDAAVTGAVETKAAKVALVVAKDASMADAVAADDAAQDDLLTKQTARDNAKYNVDALDVLASAASDAKTAADDLYDAEVIVQGAMDLAATNAFDHLGFESGDTAAQIILRNAAETAHGKLVNGDPAPASPVVSSLADIRALYDGGTDGVIGGALLTSNTNLATTAAALADKNYKDALQTDLGTALTTAATNLIETTDPSVAKNKKDATDAVDAALIVLNGKRDSWLTLSKATVVAMADWLAAEVYTEIGDGLNGCAADGNKLSQAQDGSNGTTDGSALTATCEGICTLINAWTMVSNLPSGAAAGGGTGGGNVTTICYGVQYSTNNTSCKLIQVAVPTQGSAGDDYTCLKRVKSEKATPLIAAIAASTTSVTAYTEMTAELDTWAAKYNTQLEKIALLSSATQYKSKLDTATTAAIAALGNAGSGAVQAYNSAKAASDITDSTTVSKKADYDKRVNDIAAALLTWNNLIDTVNTQEAEQAAQEIIKGLADTDKAAQDILVGQLNTAKGDASDAKDAADVLAATALIEHGDAVDAFDLQVGVAAGTAAALTTPLSELATLRGDVVTATGDLGTAVGAVSDQQALIDEQQGVVDLAMVLRLATVVSCKEARFDSYIDQYMTAIANRAADISTIERLVDAAIADEPARGAAGSRCEKALSNGTFRPKRNAETICDTGLCCGAARIPKGEAVMIIETCQTEGTTEYAYQPPRAAMETTAPEPVPAPFLCIDGAQKLAAAASALAAAVYMLA